MILPVLMATGLVLAAPQDPLDQGRRIGGWSFALHVCALAGYDVRTEPAEKALEEFESGLARYGLSRGDGARAFDEGMALELQAFDVSGGSASEADGRQVIAARAGRIRLRCRLVAEALPGSILEIDDAETRVEKVVATWYAAAHE